MADIATQASLLGAFLLTALTLALPIPLARADTAPQNGEAIHV